ncbi:cupin domain-containing protein [Actinospica durhamensis]|uniref:Cupin domain-containing protein n=1 Tax=Actinospica durhamensis TaxID=1508375 RepID=A0A941INK0_9ACTN|nr:cupin domain-containing protein [Actinospica durhamensis]
MPLTCCQVREAGPFGQDRGVTSFDLTAPFALEVADAVLTEYPLDPEQVLEGTPRVSSLTLHEAVDPATGRTVERGVWEITPGVVVDVEADELFVVLSGRATIAFADGPSLEVGPGSVAVLPEGAVTRWTVHETLRKVYQITSDASSDA